MGSGAAETISCDDEGREAALLAVAATALGAAIQVRDGLYEPRGLAALTIALAAGLLYFHRPERIRAFSPGPRGVRWIFAGLVAINFLQCITAKLPGSWHGPPATPFYLSLISLGAVLGVSVVLSPRLNRVFFLALLVVFCVAGAWIIRRVPQPYMDVWILQTEGVKAFRAGHNPFAAAFADIYHRPELYAPGALRGGVVHQGFPYPPVVFWMDWAGYTLGGDYRWANLAEIALAVWLVAFARPGSRFGLSAATLFLFTPRVLFVIESGWTEPATVVLFAATIFCACRARWLMPVFLGLFLCSKQYLLWAIPPVIVLAGGLRRGRLVRTLCVAFATGCVVSLPLILWDVKAFVAANFGVADTAAFRSDALSYLALFANVTGRAPSAGLATVVGFGVGALATAWVTFRARRTPTGYAAAVAVAHLLFFAFYKFAFCNYYYFIVAAFCCALGAMGRAGAEPAVDGELL